MSHKDSLNSETMLNSIKLIVKDMLQFYCVLSTLR
jgi:hypothetical protein